MKTSIIATMAALAVVTLRVSADAASPPAAFKLASIHLEQNAADGDGEIVVQIKSATDGLAQIQVVAPNGKAINLEGAKKRLGAGQLRFESPEPPLAEIKAAYPEGVYTFKARAVDGSSVRGTSTLSHTVLPSPAISYPAPDATGVPTNATMQWTAVPGATGYFIELELPDLDRVITIDLAPGTTSFAPPAGWLVPNANVVFAVGSVAANENRSFSEVLFSTAP